MKSISLIIPFHNGEKKLKTTFDGLNKVSLPRGLKLAQIIFVDNGSTDRSFQALSDLASSCQLPISIVSYAKKVSNKSATREGLAHSKSMFNLVLKPDLSDFEERLKRLANKISKVKKPHIPTLSVVMPVYNAEKYLNSAINSVLKQTFRDFEFIIVDDASTDESYKIIEHAARRSRRIKVLRNEKRMGISVTAKKAVDEAKGNFIARMGARDICFAKRFEKQLAHLRSNPKTVAVGTQCLLIDSRGRTIGEKTLPQGFEKIYEYAYRIIPIQASSLMIAKKRLPIDFEYQDSNELVSELDLIFKLFKYGRVENLSDALLKFRVDEHTALADSKQAFLPAILSRAKAPFAYAYRPTITGTIIMLSHLFTLPVFLFCFHLYPAVIKRLRPPVISYFDLLPLHKT